MSIDTSQILPGGHRWMRCSSCGQPALALEPGGRCRQRAAIAKTSAEGVATYSCGGKLRLVDVRVTAAAIARGEVEGCERNGCGNAAALATGRGERCCLRCLAELARLLG